jgi:two-component system response regulator PilR (NtrC family)
VAAKVLGQGPVDLVITDVKLPDGDGIEILRHVKAASPETVVIVITAFGSTETAVAALKLGAHDYLLKPFDVDELKIVVRNALESQELREENLRLKKELGRRHGLEQVIGVSPPMVALFDMVRSIAPTTSTVLLNTPPDSPRVSVVVVSVRFSTAVSVGYCRVSLVTVRV